MIFRSPPVQLRIQDVASPADRSIKVAKSEMIPAYKEFFVVTAILDVTRSEGDARLAQFGQYQWWVLAAFHPQNNRVISFDFLA